MMYLAASIFALGMPLWVGIAARVYCRWLVAGKPVAESTPALREDLTCTA